MANISWSYPDWDYSDAANAWHADPDAFCIAWENHVLIALRSKLPPRYIAASLKIPRSAVNRILGEERAILRQFAIPSSCGWSRRLLLQMLRRIEKWLEVN